MALSNRAREILDDKAIAHVGFVDDEGRPHVSAVWVNVTDDGQIEFNTAEGRRKDDLVKEGAPVAISVTRPGNDYEHVLVRGTVTARTTEGADEHIDSLAKKYLGEEKYPFRSEGEQRFKVTVAPD